jgi:hypothetical protein
MNANLIDVLGRAAVPIAVYGSFALFRKYLPASRPANSTRYSVQELDETFAIKNWVFGLATFLIAIIVASLVCFILIMLNKWFLEQDGPAIFELVPTKVIWMFFPGFLALSGCYELTILLWRLLGDYEEASRYVERTNMRAGYDTRRALVWMLLLIAAPIGIATIFAVPMHTSFKSEGISIQHYAKLRPDRYSYQQIDQIAYVKGYRLRSGKLEAHPSVTIHFKNGNRWSSADSPYEDTGIHAAILGFLSAKTGLRAGSFETEADMPR